MPAGREWGQGGADMCVDSLEFRHLELLAAGDVVGVGGEGQGGEGVRGRVWTYGCVGSGSRFR